MKYEAYRSACVHVVLLWVCVLFLYNVALAGEKGKNESDMRATLFFMASLLIVMNGVHLIMTKSNDTFFDDLSLSTYLFDFFLLSRSSSSTSKFGSITTEICETNNKQKNKVSYRIHNNFVGVCTLLCVFVRACTCACAGTDFSFTKCVCVPVRENTYREVRSANVNTEEVIL